jgi:hypothetical protein
VEESLLTTEDNPFNPFTQWDEWFSFDILNGYNTCSLLDRTVISTAEYFDDGAIAEAQQRIVRMNLSGKHLLVTRKNFAALIQNDFDDSSD